MFDPKVNQYIQLLKEFNETTNIYSKRSYGQLHYHVQDSINIAEQISNSKIHVDLGSGSGLPGIVLSIMSNVEVICIESKERKREFLEYAKSSLELDNLHIYNGDVQSFTKNYSGAKSRLFQQKRLLSPLNYCCIYRCFVLINTDQMHSVGYQFLLGKKMSCSHLTPFKQFVPMRISFILRFGWIHFDHTKLI